MRILRTVSSVAGEIFYNGIIPLAFAAIVALLFHQLILMYQPNHQFNTTGISLFVGICLLYFGLAPFVYRQKLRKAILTPSAHSGSLNIFKWSWTRFWWRISLWPLLLLIHEAIDEHEKKV